MKQEPLGLTCALRVACVQLIDRPVSAPSFHHPNMLPFSVGIGREAVLCSLQTARRGFLAAFVHGRLQHELAAERRRRGPHTVPSPGLDFGGWGRSLLSVWEVTTQAATHHPYTLESCWGQTVLFGLQRPMSLTSRKEVPSPELLCLRNSPRLRKLSWSLAGLVQARGHPIPGGGPAHWQLFFGQFYSCAFSAPV